MGKGQIFMVDLIFGIGIFVAAVILFFAIKSNLEPQQDSFDVLVNDARAISSVLMTPGAPENWTLSNFTQIGFVDSNYRLNSTKAENVMNLTRNMTVINNLLGVNSEFAVHFVDRRGNILNFNGCVFTNSDLVVDNITPHICGNFSITGKEFVVNSERLVLNNSEIVKVVVQTWR